MRGIERNNPNLLKSEGGNQNVNIQLEINDPAMSDLPEAARVGIEHMLQGIAYTIKCIITDQEALAAGGLPLGEALSMLNSANKEVTLKLSRAAEKGRNRLN